VVSVLVSGNRCTISSSSVRCHGPAAHWVKSRGGLLPFPKPEADEPCDSTVFDRPTVAIRAIGRSADGDAPTLQPKLAEVPIFAASLSTALTWPPGRLLGQCQGEVHDRRRVQIF